MTGSLGRLLQQSGIYALGNILIKLSGLILALFYLDERYLTKAAFANLGVLESTVQLTIALVGSGLTTGMLTFMSDAQLGDRRAGVPFTAYVTNALAAFLILGIFWSGAPAIAGVLLEDRNLDTAIRLLGVHIAFKMVGQVPFMWMRGNERAGWYVAASLAETAALIGGVYYTLVVLGMGLNGVLWAYVFSAGASAVLLSAFMLVETRWSLQPELIGRLVRYGVPLTLVGVALPFLHTGDRYLLQWLSSKEELAVYNWAARMGGVLNTLVVQSLQLAFAVVGLKALGEGREGIAVHRRTFRHYSIWAAWLVLGLSLFAYDATALLSRKDEGYLQAAIQVFPLSLGVYFYGLYTVTANVLYASGRTKAIGLTVLGAAVFNALLNLVFIPLMGGLGAALATLLAYAALMLVTTKLAEHTHHVRFSWPVLATACMLAGGLWAVSLPSEDWGMAARLVFRAGLALGYPVLVLLLGLYSREELATGISAVKQRMGIG